MNKPDLLINNLVLSMSEWLVVIVVFLLFSSFVFAALLLSFYKRPVFWAGVKLMPLYSSCLCARTTNVSLGGDLFNFMGFIKSISDHVTFYKDEFWSLNSFGVYQAVAHSVSAIAEEDLGE
jgi:hypothetical protein